MKKFMDEDFLLTTNSSKELYHHFAENMPIIDYHNHLDPKQIARNISFNDITQAWLNGDHYKWRAMRANGVKEEYITGSKSGFEKFERWAATVPYTLRNPLFHWTHLELQRYFGIYGLLDAHSAKKIYEETSSKLASCDYSVQSLLRKMNVEALCTTDDPSDSLEYHQQLKAMSTDIIVKPAFRPDKAMAVENIAEINRYLDNLEEVCNLSIESYETYLKALKARHDHFNNNGCSLSDHGLEHVYAEDYTEHEVALIFRKVRSKRQCDLHEISVFKSAVLLELAHWNHEKGWVQQFHLGALRNNNSRMLSSLGPDTGWDSIGDFSQAGKLSKFLDRLDADDRLAKTILYNLNPADNAMMAAMTGNFNDGSVAGKVQWGAAWWFLDQKDGIENHINTLSNIGLISRFIGMLTDSRSFLSYPRHEYFRRILCNLFGSEIEKGELPNDIDWIGKIVQDICYYNAKNYFNFEK